MVFLCYLLKSGFSSFKQFWLSAIFSTLAYQLVLMRSKIPALSLALTLLSLLILLAGPGCQKEVYYDISSTKKFPVTVEGIVTGSNGIPLQNVLINAGSIQARTDANGSFRITNVNYSTTETFVTASAPGYFTGSRTFFARQNSNHFLKIQLLPRTEAGMINAASGGNVQVGSASIIFPANAFALQDGSSYSGMVSVKAAHLDPTDPLLNLQMPGDLRGILSTGEMRGLNSFGMLNVELDGTAGQKLKLKTGISAQLVFPIPNSLQAVAPSTIPLWHFDESVGIWKEEGQALRSGNNYTGSVSHFSFWNADVPCEFVHIEMRIVNQLQQPVQGARVKLKSMADSTTSYDYTDAQGYVDGFVPKNVQLRREIYNECNTLVSSTMIGPFSSNTNLGNVQITSVTNQQTISGTVTNCNSLPLANGYVMISLPGQTLYANVTAGVFNTTFTSCTSGGNAMITAVDLGTGQQGNPVSVPLTGPTVVVPPLQACGVAANEFITVTVGNTTRTWASPAYNVFAAEDTMATSGFYDMYLSANDSSSNGAVDFIFLRSEDSTSAPFRVGIQSLSIFDSQAPAVMRGDYVVDNSVSPTPMATLTQYGQVGQFITGSFSGRFIRSSPPNVDTVTVNCSFNLRRLF